MEHEAPENAEIPDTGGTNMRSLLDDGEVYYLDNDPQNDETFVERFNLGQPVMQISFETSRDWESQETENGHTLNARPDETMFIYEGTETDFIIAHAATPMNIVSNATSVMGDLSNALVMLALSTEVNADGIAAAEVEGVDEEYQEVAEQFEAFIQSFIDAAENDESYSAFTPDEDTAEDAEEEAAC